jgi:uncharacterized C2H2 Zn-finger protein
MLYHCQNCNRYFRGQKQFERHMHKEVDKAIVKGTAKARRMEA